jgi:hypothetical protein
MRIFLILILVAFVGACGRTVTAPETACSTVTTTKNYPWRDARGDSVSYFTVVTPATCR